MADATRLVSTAACETVQNISELYDGYHADLVLEFVGVIRLLHAEPSTRAQRHLIKRLATGFANKVNIRIEEEE